MGAFTGLVHHGLWHSRKHIGFLVLTTRPYNVFCFAVSDSFYYRNDKARDTIMGHHTYLRRRDKKDKKCAVMAVCSWGSGCEGTLGRITSGNSNPVLI